MKTKLTYMYNRSLKNGQEIQWSSLNNRAYLITHDYNMRSLLKAKRRIYKYLYRIDRVE